MTLTNGTAIDISNYSGHLGTPEVEWLRDNVQLVIVRLSTEDGGRQREIAAQQVTALAAAGIPWQGYLWAYWADDCYEHWKRAQELLPVGWPGYYGLNIWIDLEDTATPAIGTQQWVNSYANLLRADGFAPGVYTGRWWTVRHAAAFHGDRGRYWQQYPLWFANYSVPPGGLPPGIDPWEKVAMHQYASVEQGLVLRSYDLSVINEVG